MRARPRLIGTGSREFTEASVVAGAIGEAVAYFGRGLIVVHGAAHRGADVLIDRAAHAAGLEVERHRADWDGPCRPSCVPGHRGVRRDGVSYCPAAGDYRNQEMVDAGADGCAAFLVPRSLSPCKGTRDCARRAEAAGVPVRWYYGRGPA